MATKLGFAENKTKPPKDMAELLNFLSNLLSATVNHEVDIEVAKTASNITDRIIQAIQADTRMKALAIASAHKLSDTGGFATISLDHKLATHDLNNN